MPINTLQDFIDIFNAASGAEKLAFKSIIVNGLNSQDLADIITASTRKQKEALAVLIAQTHEFLADTRRIADDALKAAGLATANTWFDTTIQPTLLWNNSQPLAEQRANILVDYNTIKALLQSETDPFRLDVLNKKLVQGEAKFKEIKVLIRQGG